MIQGTFRFSGNMNVLFVFFLQHGDERFHSLSIANTPPCLDCIFRDPATLFL